MPVVGGSVGLVPPVGSIVVSVAVSVAVSPVTDVSELVPGIDVLTVVVGLVVVPDVAVGSEDVAVALPAPPIVTLPADMPGGAGSLRSSSPQPSTAIAIMPRRIRMLVTLRILACPEALRESPLFVPPVHLLPDLWAVA
jgi:hypothetical protein